MKGRDGESFTSRSITRLVKLDRDLRFEPERLPHLDDRHIRLAVGRLLRPAGDVYRVS